MKSRMIIAIVLAVLALPLLVLGLIDPLEGGVALLAAIALGVVIRLLSRVPFPKLTWISMLVAISLGVLTLAIAVIRVPAGDAEGTVANPLSGGLIALLWAYRAAGVVVIVGGVLYLVRLVRAMRSAPTPSPSRPE